MVQLCADARLSIQNIFSKDCDAFTQLYGLIRVVFYEREIMDLIPQLLSKCHEARKYVSTWFITDIVELAHAVLAIGEQMSEKSMLVRQRRTRPLNAESCLLSFSVISF